MAHAAAVAANVPATPACGPRWEHFPHGADIGVRGFGHDRASAFEQAALALTAIVVDPALVLPRRVVVVACEAPDERLLLAAWLNAVIYEMAVRRMVFARYAVRIDDGALSGRAWGQDIDRLRHAPGAEPKGATPTASAVSPVTGGALLIASEALLRDMEDKVAEQLAGVAALPGVVEPVLAMPDAHWGYGFPIGGVAAFDAEDGVVSAGGVGFDISCGVRLMTSALTTPEILAVREALVRSLAANIPAGLGSRGSIVLDEPEMDAMLRGGARWAVAHGHGEEADLARIEEDGRMEGADPGAVSSRARQRQREETGTLGSGNHYLEVQEVAEIFDAGAAAAFGLETGRVVVSIHSGSRGLGHQIGSEFLQEMAATPEGLALPDPELAYARCGTALARRYLGAMRAAINCALANRQILAQLTRRVFAHHFPGARLNLLYDVSHNTCKEEVHHVGGRPRRLLVHRKGATRALAGDHPSLPEAFRGIGQPVLIGGSMGGESYVLAGPRGDARTQPPDGFASACHGAGRRMSRHEAARRWRGRAVQDELRARGILVLSPSARGIAEEAPGAYKDAAEVVDAAAGAGIARKVARLQPLICIKG